MDYVPSLDLITIDGDSIGDRMNSTYNEDPYIIKGYYQDEYGKFFPVNEPTTVQENWAKGIVDFIPNSLIWRSSFTNVTVED